MLFRGGLGVLSGLRFLPPPLLLLLAVSTACAEKNESLERASQQRTVALTFPHYAGRAVRVERKRIKIDDGDTFKARSVVIRILGLDTPEIKHPRHGFHQDQPYGRQAFARAVALFDSAAVIEYVPAGLDRYERRLAHVFVDGELFAVKMIEAGLAWETVSHYGDNGFPDLAELILAAAEQAGTPAFQNPQQWRKQHRAKRGESMTGVLKKILDWINR